MITHGVVDPDKPRADEEDDTIMTVRRPYWSCRWENTQTQRYYVCRVEHDLFGDLLCTASYGGIGSARGQVRKTALDSEKSAKRYIRRVAAARRRHGYRVIFCCTTRDDWRCI